VTKRAVCAIILALLLPACNDEGNGPAAPSSPAATPPPAVAPAPPPAPVPSSNQPPALEITVRPDQPSGPAPREVNVNMCGSTDPDGDRMIFEFKWGGTGGAHFSYLCRSSHTYERPGRYRAFFCANDDHDHRVCANVLVDIA
jgi:hypothetical protein